MSKWHQWHSVSLHPSVCSLFLKPSFWQLQLVNKAFTVCCFTMNTEHFLFLLIQNTHFWTVALCPVPTSCFNWSPVKSALNTSNMSVLFDNLIVLHLTYWCHSTLMSWNETLKPFSKQIEIKWNQWLLPENIRNISGKWSTATNTIFTFCASTMFWKSDMICRK